MYNSHLSWPPPQSRRCLPSETEPTRRERPAVFRTRHAGTRTCHPLAECALQVRHRRNAPISATSAPNPHAVRVSVAVPSRCATTAGERKMPAPITPPMTSIVPENTPRRAIVSGRCFDVEPAVAGDVSPKLPWRQSVWRNTHSATAGSRERRSMASCLPLVPYVLLSRSSVRDVLGARLLRAAAHAHVRQYPVRRSNCPVTLTTHLRAD